MNTSPAETSSHNHTADKWNLACAAGTVVLRILVRTGLSSRKIQAPTIAPFSPLPLIEYDMAYAPLPADSIANFYFEPEDILPSESYQDYRGIYTIKIGSSNPDLPRDYSGIANITFDRNSIDDWVILVWEDERVPDYPSLTDLKISMPN